MKKILFLFSMLFISLSVQAQTPDTAAISEASALYQPKSLKGGVAISATAPLVPIQKLDNKIQWVRSFMQGQIDGVNAVLPLKLNTSTAASTYATISSVNSKVNTSAFLDTMTEQRNNINYVSGQVTTNKDAINRRADSLKTAVNAKTQPDWNATSGFSQILNKPQITSQWSFLGNAATAGDFLGTTNNVPFTIKQNNQNAITFYNSNPTVFGDMSVYSGTSTAGVGGTAFGNSNFANDYGVAIGIYDTTGGTAAIAMGYGSKAFGENSVAMGNGANASGDRSVAMGNGTQATAAYATAMGTATTASGEGSVAMGSSATASGYYSFSVGLQTHATSEASVAMGENTSASGFGSVAFGEGTEASGGHSFAVGATTTASGNESVAMGLSSVASGSSSVAMGNSSVASGNSSVALGGNAIGGYSFSVGSSDTYANAGGSVAIGDAATANGLESIVLGHAANSGSLAQFSIAIGAETVVQGVSSVAIGTYLTSKAVGGVALGIANDESDSPSSTTAASTDRIYQIGNGSTNNSTKSNALTVLRSGNIGIGATALVPTTQLDLSGSTIRLRTNLTPSSTSDSQGNTGDVAKDNNYIYVKTASGWKRAALSTF